MKTKPPLPIKLAWCSGEEQAQHIRYKYKLDTHAHTHRYYMVVGLCDLKNPQAHTHTYTYVHRKEVYQRSISGYAVLKNDIDGLQSENIIF